MKYLEKRLINASYASKEKTTEDLTDTVQADLNFLKSVVATDENMDMIKSKLIATARHRFTMGSEMKLNFLEQLPIFFTNPDLVENFFN